MVELMIKTNEDLKGVYNKAFSNNASYAGENDSFFTFATDDVTGFILSKISFGDKSVLEVGCGTGMTATAVANAGARRVLAIDYAQEAINGCCQRHAHPVLQFKVDKYENIKDTFDCIILQEVIEHLDNPEQTVVELSRLLQPDGKLIVTCPNFTNLRGYIWMTLQTLLQVPMSLSDLHFLSPFDFIEIAKKNNLKLEWETFAHERVYGDKLIVDMRKRLTNALRDAHLDNSRVDEFMQWLNKVITLDTQVTRYNGGKGFYVFSRS